MEENWLASFLAGESMEMLKLPILAIIVMIILWFFYQLEAIVMRKIGDIVLEIPNKILLVVFFIIAFATLAIGMTMRYADFSEPLTKKQVELAVLDNFGRSIKRISFLKGGGAGDIGYFFVELEPSGYVIVNGDSRLPPFIESSYKEKLNFSDYFLQRTIRYPTRQLSVETGYSLQWESLKSRILRRKNERQIFWEKYASGEKR
jgi:hypothetical protein